MRSPRLSLLVLLGIALVASLAIAESDRIHERAAMGLSRGMPPREAELARGFVLGEDDRVDEGTKEDVRRAGLSHLLRWCRSGQNGASMRFPKLTRTLIANAKGKPVEIVWPEAEDPPERGHTYTVQTRHDRPGAFSVLVHEAAEGADGKWRATVQVAEPLRPLRIKAKVAPDPEDEKQFRPELEPEQVPLSYQRQLDAEGERKTIRCGEDQRERRAERRAEQRRARASRRLAA
jgi:hypothetical protein